MHFCHVTDGVVAGKVMCPILLTAPALCVQAVARQPVTISLVFAGNENKNCQQEWPKCCLNECCKISSLGLHLYTGELIHCLGVCLAGASRMYSVS